MKYAILETNQLLVLLVLVVSLLSLKACKSLGRLLLPLSRRLLPASLIWSRKCPLLEAQRFLWLKLKGFLQVL